MARIKRNVRPTPKDAAADSVRHAKEIADELSRKPILDRDKFAYRFNDFIRASRAALAMLPKEKGVRLPACAGKPGLPDFVKAEIDALTNSDARFKHFMETLKDVSAHDLIVKPDTAEHFASLEGRLTMRGSLQAERRDREGNIVERRDTDVPQPDAGKATAPQRRNRKPRQSVLYYVKDWPNEDLVTYCREVVTTLDLLVRRVYAQFP